MKLHISTEEVRSILCEHARAISHKHHVYNTMIEDEDGVVLSYVAPAGTVVKRHWTLNWAFGPKFVPAPEEPTGDYLSERGAFFSSSLRSPIRIHTAIERAADNIRDFGRAFTKENQQ